jgi:hypothetical protein
MPARTVKYLEGEWRNISDKELGMKCLFSCTHSGTLLQVRSTNALELYHSVLKNTSKLSLRTFVSSIKEILRINEDIVDKANKAKQYKSLRIFSDLIDLVSVVMQTPIAFSRADPRRI